MTKLQQAGWTSVPEEDFEEYLKSCPDYTCCSYGNIREFHYRSNGKLFAELTNSGVYVDPSILITQ